MSKRIPIATLVLAVLAALILLGQPSPIPSGGTYSMQGTGTAGSAVTTGIVNVQGTSPAGGAFNMNPLLIGMVGASTTMQAPVNMVVQGDASTGVNSMSVGQIINNGSGYDRRRSADLTNYPVSSTLTGVNSIGAALGEKGGRWAVFHSPAASSQATISIALESGVRHVADCVSFTAAAATAPTATALNVQLRDGATGAGTVLQQWAIVAPATVGTHATFSVCGLNLVGTTATAMTLEFSAGLTNEIESVSLTGFNVN